MRNIKRVKERIDKENEQRMTLVQLNTIDRLINENNNHAMSFNPTQSFNDDKSIHKNTLTQTKGKKYELSIQMSNKENIN